MFLRRFQQYWIRRQAVIHIVDARIGEGGMGEGKIRIALDCAREVIQGGMGALRRSLFKKVAPAHV